MSLGFSMLLWVIRKDQVHISALGVPCVMLPSRLIIGISHIPSCSHHFVGATRCLWVCACLWGDGCGNFQHLGERRVGRVKPSAVVVLVKLRCRVQRGSSRREEPTAGGLPWACKADTEMLCGSELWPTSEDAGKEALFIGPWQRRQLEELLVAPYQYIESV